MGKADVKDFFAAPVRMHIKTILPNLLREKRVSIFEVEDYLPELSEKLKAKISEEMADYGISLEKLWIHGVQKPEKDPFYIALNRQRGEKVTLVNQGEIDLQRAEYQRRVEIIGHAGTVQKRKMDIDAQRYKQEQLGFTYQQARGFDVMEKIAENEGSGSDLRNAAMGIGMGFGIGGTFSDAITNISNNTMMSGLNDAVKPSTAWNDDIPNDAPEMINLKKQMPSSSSKDDNDMNMFKRKIEKLTMMKDAGLLSDEELAVQKKLILDEIKQEK